MSKPVAGIWACRLRVSRSVTKPRCSPLPAMTVRSACFGLMIFPMRRILHGLGFVADVDIGAGNVLAALGRNGRIRAWNLVSRELVCEPTADPAACRLVVDGSGDYVIVGGTGAQRPSPAERAGTRGLGAEGCRTRADERGAASLPRRGRAR